MSDSFWHPVKSTEKPEIKWKWKKSVGVSHLPRGGGKWGAGARRMNYSRILKALSFMVMVADLQVASPVARAISKMGGMWFVAGSKPMPFSQLSLLQLR